MIISPGLFYSNALIGAFLSTPITQEKYRTLIDVRKLTSSEIHKLSTNVDGQVRRERQDRCAAASPHFAEFAGQIVAKSQTAKRREVVSC